MNPDEIKRLAKNPNFIPGIYNYCDRWCERCTFTKRCMNYAMSEDDDEETRDITNEKFWNKIHENFQLTLQLIKETAAEHGIDLDKIEIDTIEVEERKAEREILKQHACAKISNKYIDAGRKWLEERKDTFLKKEDELNHQLEMGASEQLVKSEVNEITDAIEIIQWYLFFIHVKIMRALMGRRDGEDDDYPKDSDGSAKIALIAADRSIAAWGIMLNQFPEEEDNILPILAMLDKIRKSVEKEFPEARNFKRPGFDN